MIINKINNRIKIFLKRINLQKEKVFLHPSSIIDLNTKFEGNSKINDNCVLINCFVGRGTFISSNSQFYYAKIGRFCSIAPNVECIIGNHPSHTFVSTHPAFFSTKKQAGFTFSDEQKFEEFVYTNERTRLMFEIGNDVWIGQSVKLLNGIKIGDGAIIAAGSVVINDVPSYSIVGGVPAKMIKMRFLPYQIEFLKSFKWWEKSDLWFAENSESFTNIETFMKNNL